MSPAFPQDRPLTDVCWTPDAVDAILDLRAASISDTAFLATHHPAVLRRRENYTDPRGATYSEAEFHKEFFSPERSNLLVPVIGPSGSGKSHLIRWLYTQVPEDDRLHVIYVPKRQTNLRAVLHLILQNLQTPEFDTFRNNLKDATEGLSLEQGVWNLRQALAYMIKTVPDDEAVRFPDGTPLSEYDFQVHREHLPYFLNEKVVSERLDVEGGVIHRLMSEALHGRTDDKAEAFAITEADLPLDMLDIHQAGTNIQEYHGDLVTNPQYLHGALALLNHFRDAALREVYKLGGTELMDIMRQVREFLKRQGKTLVLLIEDFALLQGIQKPLLEALIEDDYRELCSIRVALAVTTGFFRNMETVRTRLSFIVDLDITYSEEKGRFLREQLTARHLNAVRWGEQDLETHHLSSTSTLQSICTECAVRAKCHESFGWVKVKNIDGRVGLFPFNIHALEVVNRHHQDSEQALNPRELIRGLAFTLREAQTGVPGGHFPTTRFQETYHLDAPLLRAADATKLDGLTPNAVHQEQYKFITRVWGGAPATVHAFSRALQEAFRYPQLNDAPPSKPKDEREDEKNPLVDPPILISNPLPESLSPTAVALEEWANNRPLIQTRATELRNLVADLVTERLNFERLTLHAATLKENGIWGTQRNVEFVNQANPMTGDAFRLTLPLPGQTRAQVSEALQSYMHYKNKGQWPSANPDAPWIFEEVVTAWTEHVTAHISGRTTAAGTLSAAAAGLMWIAVSQGKYTSGTTSQDWPYLMLQSPIAPSASAPPKWAKAVKDLADKHVSLSKTLLTYAGIRKGTGKVAMVDATLILKPFKRQRPRLADPFPEGSATSIQDPILRVLDTLEAALDEVLQHVRTLETEIKRYLPEDDTLSLLPSLVREALNAADQAGISPFQKFGNSPAPAEQLKTLITTLTNLPVLSILKHCESITAENVDIETRVDRAARFPWDDARRIEMVLRETDDLLCKSLATGRSKGMVAQVSGTATSLASTLCNDLQGVFDDLISLQPSHQVTLENA